MVPAGRRYLPGTMVLETSWETRTGWVDRPRRAVHRPLAPRGGALGHATGARRPTTRRSTCSCGRPSAWRARRRSTSTASRRSTTAGWRPSGSTPGPGTTRPRPSPRAWSSSCSLVTDMRLGFEGPRARARTILREGDVAFVALGWSTAPAAGDLRGGLRPPGAHGALLAGVARARLLPRPPLAHLPAAQRADAQGPLLRAHRAR